MTIRLDMRQTVAKGARVLGDSTVAVREFFQKHLHEDGGFEGRDGRGDLYYTVFGLEASLALGVPLDYERIAHYLDRIAVNASADLVQLACLIRCKANLDDLADRRIDPARMIATIECLELYRRRDGGFGLSPNAKGSSVYAAFLALGIYQDVGIVCPDAARLVRSIHSLQRPDGGYSNESTMTVSATAPTAAAVTILHYLDEEIPEVALKWLVARAAPHGGFLAIPMYFDESIPDLLSTATALHALFLADVALEALAEVNLDYIDSLWSAEGGFRGHPADDILDCEYTYYALLALGDLAQP
jgi:prenyltransferase beta subunit